MINRPVATWRTFTAYLLVLAFMLFSVKVSGQVSVAQFNAKWNSCNTVKWISKLDGCDVVIYVDVTLSPEIPKKHKIQSIPTIIIFKGGIEVSRFTSDIRFKLVGTRKEVQEEINRIKTIN